MTADKGHPKPQDETPDAAATEPQAPAKPAGLAALFTKKWLAILIVASLAVHAAGFAYYRLRARPAAPSPPAAEVPLGAFHFEAVKPEAGQVAKADFSLHVALLDAAEALGRQRLETKRLRVQQDVEELLRKTNGGDFDDPALRDFKRQLQEQINQTLGIRAISEIIITDLKFQRDPRPGRETALAAEK